MLAFLGAAGLAAHATARVDSHDHHAFALGYEFTTLHESFRATIRRMEASSKEGLRKSLRKKMNGFQHLSDRLQLDIDLAEFVLGDLQRARSLSEYNAVLNRIRRKMPTERARSCYDLGRTFALFRIAVEEAETVSEQPFFGIVRPNYVNGVNRPERTQGKFFELGHQLNNGLRGLRFTPKRLDLEIQSLDRAQKALRALLTEANAYFGTAARWDRRTGE